MSKSNGVDAQSHASAQYARYAQNYETGEYPPLTADSFKGGYGEMKQRQPARRNGWGMEEMYRNGYEGSERAPRGERYPPRENSYGGENPALTVDSFKGGYDGMKQRQPARRNGWGMEEMYRNNYDR